MYTNDGLHGVCFPTMSNNVFGVFFVVFFIVVVVVDYHPSIHLGLTSFLQTF